MFYWQLFCVLFYVAVCVKWHSTSGSLGLCDITCYQRSVVKYRIWASVVDRKGLGFTVPCKTDETKKLLIPVNIRHFFVTGLGTLIKLQILFCNMLVQFVNCYFELHVAAESTTGTCCYPMLNVYFIFNMQFPDRHMQTHAAFFCSTPWCALQMSWPSIGCKRYQWPFSVLWHHVRK